MMLLLAKRLRPCSVIQSFTANHKIHSILTRFCSGSATKNPDPETPDFNVVDYLVSSFGLSPEKAARISKPIAYVKSPLNPDAVRRFLEQQGFAEAEINKLITMNPSLLCCPEKSLDTNLRALRDIGLSTSALTQIILSNSATLQLRSAAAPRIKYWRDFLGGDEAALIRLFKRNRGLIGQDITNTILPKLSLLKTHGLSTQNVRKILVEISYFITSSTCVMEQNIKRTKELGFQPESKMFVHGLRAMSCVSREMLEKKVELFKSFGWSEDEFLSALRTMPQVAALSENNLRTKMNFLMGEVRCDHTYIASNPTLLAYSLDKRLKPRHHVLHLLETKGLSGNRRSFTKAIAVSDNKFVETYIIPHKGEVSGLHEAYLDACA